MGKMAIFNHYMRYYLASNTATITIISMIIISFICCRFLC